MTLSKNFNSLQKKYRPYSESEAELKFIFSSKNTYLQNGIYKEFYSENATIIGMINSDLNIDMQTAYFGFMAIPNSDKEFKDLFAQLELWAKDHKCTKVIGPINFSTFNSYRLKLNQFDKMPFLKEPTNPDYYPDMIQKLGYKILNRYHSYYVNDHKKVSNWYQKYSVKSDLFKFANDYEYLQLNANIWLDHLDELHKKAELVFGNNFAYRSIDLNTFKITYGNLIAHALCDKTSLLIKHKDKGIIGLILNFPNYMEGNEPKTLLIKTLGILPEHSMLGGQIIKSLLEIIPAALESYEEFVFCLMQEGNYPSLIGKEFASDIADYALFKKDL